ncbi:hypothetical protein C8R31_107105 [Nitrosospira sp. Nsp2]|nr:hypothetical protein C8R31_107105 [Nitrosospira sp. Nsp2]
MVQGWKWQRLSKLLSNVNLANNAYAQIGRDTPILFTHVSIEPEPLAPCHVFIIGASLQYWVSSEGDINNSLTNGR